MSDRAHGRGHGCGRPLVQAHKWMSHSSCPYTDEPFRRGMSHNLLYVPAVAELSSGLFSSRDILL